MKENFRPDNETDHAIATRLADLEKRVADLERIVSKTDEAWVLRGEKKGRKT